MKKSEKKIKHEKMVSTVNLMANMLSYCVQDRIYSAIQGSNINPFNVKWYEGAFKKILNTFDIKGKTSVLQ